MPVAVLQTITATAAPATPGATITGVEFFANGVSLGTDATSPYTMESYDAAALIMLAMQAAGSTDSKVYGAKIMDLANAPGEKILPGEIGKALELIAAGTDIDYDGASGVELVGAGESAGRYRQFEVKGGKFETVTFR